MRESGAICVSRDIDDHKYATKGFFLRNDKNFNDFECQCKIDNSCTCKRITHRDKYFNSSRQVYRSQRYIPRGFTEVGVGSVKTVCKKRVKRIYLPETEETGVGSSELSLVHNATKGCGSNFYHKKTSSKCIGGVIDAINVPLLNKKLSPIVQIISETTSPNVIIPKAADTSFLNEKDTLSTQNIQIDTQFELPNNKLLKGNPTDKMAVDTVKGIEVNKDNRSPAICDYKTYSSDSLVQHIHNLENPSNEKVRTSIDLIENKLEREYRKIFTINTKESNTNTKVEPTSDLKSASLLRRRFEALRKGLNKKEKQITVIVSSKLSVPSKKDVSIASDPPSLESRSYSNTKVYSPMPSISNVIDTPQINQPADTLDSDCNDVKDMFRLWGKKFNLEEDNCNTIPKKRKKKVEISLPEDKCNKKEKRKRFLFFRKKNNNKPKQPYRSKQGVTAGRCELGDGLMIKFGTMNKCTSEMPIVKKDKISKDNNIIGKDWLKLFLSKKIDSRNSVRIRWNNNMYTTSSSTVFELMDCVYKNNGVLLSSKSEVMAEESSNYYSYLHSQVNFMKQNVQAWMIPKTIIDDPIMNTSINMLYSNQRKGRHEEMTLSNQKLFIEKSKAFSQNIEHILQSKNLVDNMKPVSTQYIIIDIPKGYFSETSSDDKNNQTSDEQVYNIVEYETLNSNPYLNKIKVDNKMDKGDHASKDIQVTIDVRDNEGNEIKTLINDFEKQELTNIQASNCYIPKPCDVISVRIITQRDIRDIKKPILKINDNIDDQPDVLPPPKKSEFAESFLQDYYRNLTPLGIDLLSWCVSSDKILGSSESNSIKSFNNQGDVSKSCSNVYDGYQASAIVSSCETSSCSHCKVVEEEKRKDDCKTPRFFSKLIKKRTYEPPIAVPVLGRVLPKDSFEVFRRRKMYALSNKSKWGVNDDRSEPLFLPKRSKQSNFNECPKEEEFVSDINRYPKTKCKRRVIFKNSEILDEILKKQLSDRTIEGILSFKGSAGCDTCKVKSPQNTKQAHVIPHEVCEIPEPPCKETRVKERKPACSKKNSPTCLVPTPPSCPVGPPSPCQKPCPPSPPPCRKLPPCAIPEPKSPSRCSLSDSSTQWKPIESPIHSPKACSPKRSRSCVCSKKQSISSIPKCQLNKKTSCISTPPHISPPSSRNSCQKCRSTCKVPQQHSPSEKCKKCSSNDFPWPLKQDFNTPLEESNLGIKRCSPQTATVKSSNKCFTAIKRLIQKVSSSSFKQKDCRPDCANRYKEFPRPIPVAPPPTLASVPTSPPDCRPKMEGLHLKKLPMPKSSSKDCLSLDENGIIRLNSREKITIKLRQQTPSTEEIREGCNIKAQDEDGRTLYERIDYRKVDRNKMHFVKDMYRNSQVQRISTPDTDIILDKKPLEINECKSDTSVSNIIEINLNLKFRQEDKTTETNSKKSEQTLTKDHENPEVNINQKSPKDIYLVQDKTGLLNEEIEKKDVNIKIIIKNYKAPGKTATKKQSVNLSTTDEFSKKISEKFQTVSTGYSDIIERQTYSVHRATINLVNSSDNNKSLDKSSIELSQKELTDAKSIDENKSVYESSTIPNKFSSYVISESKGKSQEILTSNIISKVEINSSISFTEKTDARNDDKSADSLSIVNTNEHINSDSTNLEDKIKSKCRKYSRDDKRNILKLIFETASEIRKRKDKTEMKGIRQLLKAVLTSDSSDQDNFEVNNKLAEELTYASLNPVLLKESNSVTDYLDKSSISTKVSSQNESVELKYPTKENISECDTNSDVQENLGCLCTHLATRLNLKENNFASCCCRRTTKSDKEILCDIIDENKVINNDIKTHDSVHVKNEFELSIASLKKEIFEEALKNHSPRQSLLAQKYTNVCHFNSLEKRTVLESSFDEIKVTTESNFERNPKKSDNLKIINITPADVLQFNETKKAVLEIYTEKIISEEGIRMIARLPKFICDKESKIYNYKAYI